MITRKFSRNLLQTYDLNVSSKIFKFSESCDKQTNAYTFQEASYHEFLPYLQAWSRLAKPIHSPSGQTNARIRGNDLKTSKLLLSSTDPFRSFNFSRSSFFSHLLFFFLSLPLFQEKNFFFSSVSPILDTRFKRGNQKSIEAFLFRLPPLVSTPLDSARASTIPVFLFTTVVSLRSCFNYFSSLLFLRFFVDRYAFHFRSVGLVRECSFFFLFFSLVLVFDIISLSLLFAYIFSFVDLTLGCALNGRFLSRNGMFFIPRERKKG